jgi:hypothetical protein
MDMAGILIDDADLHWNFANMPEFHFDNLAWICSTVNDGRRGEALRLFFP